MSKINTYSCPITPYPYADVCSVDIRPRSVQLRPVARRLDTMRPSWHNVQYRRHITGTWTFFFLYFLCAFFHDSRGVSSRPDRSVDPSTV